MSRWPRLPGGAVTYLGEYWSEEALRAGFAPDARDEVMSLAFCLQEDPLPAACGCCPSLAGAIAIEQEDEPLRSGV